MSYVSHIRNICRATPGGEEQNEQQACEMFGAMLDGGVPDLELGAILIALHLNGHSPGAVAGFWRALDERTRKLEPPRGALRPVVLPSYGGAGPYLPLLALLLARFGVPVLMHGELASRGEFTPLYVLRELGILPRVRFADAQQALASGGFAFVPTAVLAPGLAALLSLQGRLAVRSTPHAVAELLAPFSGDDSVRLISSRDAAFAGTMRRFLTTTNSRALLVTTGAPVADATRRARVEFFDAGMEQVLCEADTACLPGAAPGIDAGAAALAAWTRKALSGEAPIPPSTMSQLACCLFACGYAGDLNEARAVVALETLKRAAA